MEVSKLCVERAQYAQPTSTCKDHCLYASPLSLSTPSGSFCCTSKLGAGLAHRPSLHLDPVLSRLAPCITRPSGTTGAGNRNGDERKTKEEIRRSRRRKAEEKIRRKRRRKTNEKEEDIEKE